MIAPGMTERDPMYGWADTGTPYPRKPRELADAELDAAIAWDRYERAVDEYYDHHYGDEAYKGRVSELLIKAEAAAQRKIDIYNRLNGTSFTAQSGEPYEPID